MVGIEGREADGLMLAKNDRGLRAANRELDRRGVPREHRLALLHGEGFALWYLRPKEARV